MTKVGYPARPKDHESVTNYSHRLARCITSDLTLGSHIAETERAKVVETVAGQIFARLVIGDDPPPRGSL